MNIGGNWMIHPHLSVNFGPESHSETYTTSVKGLWGKGKPGSVNHYCQIAVDIKGRQTW